MTAPSVAFLRILSHRTRQPVVLAVVEDEHLVRWQPRGGWTCDCPQPEGTSCEHVNRVAALLHPNVLGTEEDR